MLVKEFPYLKALGISGQHFKDVDYLALREGLAKVLSFSAVGQKFEKMKTVRDLLIAMPMLHTLDLSESTANDEVAKAIAEVGKKIQNLNISETQITFAGIQEIVNTRDLTKFKMNNLKAIGDKELQYIIEKQPGLKVFHFAGAYLTEATTMTLILKLPKLIDLTLIPAKESTWALTEGVEKALSLKKQKPQYLHIEARKLPEKLRLELEKDLPKLNLEYATAPAALETKAISTRTFTFSRIYLFLVWGMFIQFMALLRKCLIAQSWQSLYILSDIKNYGRLLMLKRFLIIACLIFSSLTLGYMGKKLPLSLKMGH